MQQEIGSHMCRYTDELFCNRNQDLNQLPLPSCNRLHTYRCSPTLFLPSPPPSPLFPFPSLFLPYCWPAHLKHVQMPVYPSSAPRSECYHIYICSTGATSFDNLCWLHPLRFQFQFLFLFLLLCTLLRLVFLATSATKKSLFYTQVYLNFPRIFFLFFLFDSTRPPGSIKGLLWFNATFAYSLIHIHSLFIHCSRHIYHILLVNCSFYLCTARRGLQWHCWLLRPSRVAA